MLGSRPLTARQKPSGWDQLRLELDPHWSNLAPQSNNLPTRKDARFSDEANELNKTPALISVGFTRCGWPICEPLR